MKKIIFTILLFHAILSLHSQLSFSQESFTVSEKGYTTVCGKLLMVDAIWMDNDIMTADIALLEKPNSKPIKGGYKTGDEITISSEEGCTYYISSVRKFGTDSTFGEVIISKTPPYASIGFCDAILSLTEGSSIKVDTLDWNISSIQEGTASIKVTSKTAYIRDITLIEGNKVWLGDCLYKVESIKAEWWDKEKDPQGHYEKNPPEVILKRIQSSIYNK